MALVVTFFDPADAAHCCAALLALADLRQDSAPLLARRLRAIAEAIADGVDMLPVPSGWANTPR